MTFDVAQDDPLMGANYFKMGGAWAGTNGCSARLISRWI